MIFIISFLASFEFFILGGNSYINPDHDGDTNIPALILLGQEIRLGHAGNWEGHFAGGMDRLTALIHNNPLGVLFAFFPAWLIVGAAIFVSALIGGWSFYSLLRRYLGIYPPLAAVAGIYYALGLNNGELYFFGAFSFCLLPLALLILHRAEGNFWGAAMMQAAIGALLGWGAGPHSIYFLLMLMLWAFFVTGLPWRKALVLTLAHLAGWLFFLVPVLPPLLSFVRESGRGAAAALAMEKQTLGQLLRFQFLEWVHGFFALRPMPLLAAAILVFPLGALDTRQRNVLLIALLFAGGFFFIPLITWAIHVAGLSFDALRLSRMSNIVALAATYGVAVAAEGLGKRLAVAVLDLGVPVFRLGFRGLSGLVLAAFSIAGLYASKMHHMEFFEYGASYKALFENKLIKSTFEALENKQPFRVVSVIPTPFHSLIRADHAWAYGLETADGFLPFLPRAVTDYWEAMYSLAPEPLPVPGKGSYTRGVKFYVRSITKDCEPSELGKHVNLRLLSSLNALYLISPCPLSDSYFTLIARTDPEERAAWSGLGRKEKIKRFLAGEYPGKDVYIYRNSLASPRVFIAGKIVKFVGQESLLRDMAFGETPNSTARLLAEDGAFTEECRESNGMAALSFYRQDELVIEADMKSCGVLVIANNYNKGWRAEIDQRPAPIFPVNLIHQGLYLKPGHHRITLRY